MSTTGAIQSLQAAIVTLAIHLAAQTMLSFEQALWLLLCLASAAGIILAVVHCCRFWKNVKEFTDIDGTDID